MALILKDRVQETSITTGTGTLTLAGAVTQFQTFSSAVGNGNTTYYTIYNAGGTDWEVGIGTVGAGTLARTTVLASSNAGSLVSFTGTLYVFGDYPADKSVYLDASGNVVLTGTVTANGVLLTGNLGTVTSVGSTAGTGISITGSPITSSGNFTITNTAPDQTVVLTAGTGITTTGTYPNFTITNTAPSSGGTVTSVAATVPTFLSVSGSPITSSGTLAISLSGTALPAANGGTGLTSSGTAGYVLTSDGTGWVSQAVTPTGSTYTRTSFTATSGQTSFSVTYTVGYVEVFLNGVLLNASDYTASSGTAVVLAVGATTGDIVETIAYSITTVSTASTATNIAGGIASQIPYQTGAGATSFIANGTSGQYLISAGTSAPAWGNLSIPSGTTIVNPTITNYTETLYAPSAGSSFTVDLANGTVQKLSLNANGTITLPSSVAGKSFVIIVTYSGAFTLTWAGGSTIKWPAGTAPTASSANGKFDIFTFFQDGTNTYGNSFGLNY